MRILEKFQNSIQDTVLTAFGYTPEGFTTIKKAKEKYTGKPRLGDMYLVKRASSSGGSALGFYHAGVYCSEEEEEIIHFTFASTGSCSSSDSSHGQGDVSKKHMKVFCGNDDFVIHRKDGEIPVNFKAKVKEAMKSTKEYDLLTYNCIHFALELLDVDSKTINDYIEKICPEILKNKPKKVEMMPLNV